MGDEDRQITLEDATIELVEKIRKKTGELYGKRWKGKTDMIFGFAVKVVLLEAFDLGEALPLQFKELRSAVLQNFREEIRELESLYLEAARNFALQGL